MCFYVYIAECSDKTLYTGYAKNATQRIIEHNTSDKGAKYTRTRRPVKLVYREEFNTLSEALARENQIKKLSRKQKIKLVERGVAQKNC